MFKLKKKNTLPEQAEQPVDKKKKKLKWILIGVVIVFLLIIVGSGDSDDKEIPTIGDNLSDYVELHSEEKTDGVTMQWYKIDPEKLSAVEDYVELLCDKYEFRTVDGKDNDYYLYHEGDTELEVLYTDNGELEYHLRVGIPDEDEDQNIISFIYVDGLFRSDEKAAEDDEKTESDSKEDEKTEDKKNPGKEEVLVSEMKADTSSGQKQGKDSVKIQSLMNFASSAFNFEKESQLNSDVMVQSFKGSSKNAELIKEYIQVLSSGSMNLKEAGYDYDDFRDVYLATYDESKEWGLSYTGSASVVEKCEGIGLDKSQKFAVIVYYTVDGDSLDGSMYWSANLTPCDLGFRSGGKNVSAVPGGKSVLAGLIRTADGKYKTTDGRFSAGLNEVMIASNGKTQSGKLEYVENTPNAGDAVKVYNGDGSKLWTVIFPRSCVQKTGMLFSYNDLLQEYQFPLNDDPNGDLGEDTIVYQFIKSKWLTATYSDSPCKDMTLRIMYYDETEQVAVYYIYTHFTEETEAFCVVDMSKAIKSEQQNSSDGSGSSVPPLNNNKGNSICAVCKNKGKLFCNRCNGSGKIVNRGSIAGFGTDEKKSFTEHKGDCPECDNGYKDCTYCNN